MTVTLIGNQYRDLINEEYKKKQPKNIEIVYVIDDDLKEKELDFSGLPIISITSLLIDNRVRSDAVLFATSYNHFIENVLLMLKEKYEGKIFLPKLFALDKGLSLWDENGFIEENIIQVDAADKFLVHVETHIVDYCNLNCKACNNFSPFVRENVSASVDNFQKDINKLKELFSGIGRLFLLGGEPLIDARLTEKFVKRARQDLPKVEIRLLTNGLLIPNMTSEFWEVIRRNQIIIHISAYPPTMEKMDLICQVLNEEKVDWIVYREVHEFVKRWTEYPFEDGAISNNLCGSSGCHYLRDGKLAKCPDSVLIKEYDKEFGTSLYQNDEIDIYQEKSASDILEKLAAPCKLCSYCAIDRQCTIPWARVQKKINKEDWILPHRYEWLLGQEHSNINRLKKDNYSLVETNSRLENERNQIIKELQECKDYIDKCHILLDNLQNNNFELIEETKKAKSELIHITESMTYKVGYILMKIPKKVCHIIRKDNKN